MQRITEVQRDFCNSYFYPTGKLQQKSFKEKNNSDSGTNTPHLHKLHIHNWALAELTVQAVQLYRYLYTNQLLCKAYRECTALHKAKPFPAVRCWICQKKEKRKIREFNSNCKNVYCCFCFRALHPEQDNSSLIKSWWMIDMASG